MIPSDITVELRNGLICSTGSGIGTYGLFPVLASADCLLKRLGIEFCSDDSTTESISGSSLGTLLQPIQEKPKISKKSKADGNLSDDLLRSLDHILYVRDRVEEDTKKKKRVNHQVVNLEKARAKMRQKIQQQEQDGDDQGSEELRVEAAVILDAWMRLVRLFNSARLLLFLFSETDGLAILAGRDIPNHILSKTIKKLSDLLEVLANADDPNQSITIINDWEKYALASIRRKSNNEESTSDANNSVMEERTPTHDVNDSVIALTDDDDSSEDANYTEDQIEKFCNGVESESPSNEKGEITKDVQNKTPSMSPSSENSKTTKDAENKTPSRSPSIEKSKTSKDVEHKTPSKSPGNEKSKTSMDVEPETVDATENIAVEIIDDSVVARCKFLNQNLDRLMGDLVTTINSQSSTDEVKSMEHAFNELTLAEASTKALHERAKDLDERFSLIVGVTGSRDYQIRKKYLLSIERLRSRVEERIRKGYDKTLKDAHLDVYGSCLSGLSLGKNADVDLSLTFSDAIEKKSEFDSGALPAKKYSRHVTDTVYRIKRKLERPIYNRGNEIMEFKNMEAVARARVPVIKGIYEDANNPHSEDGSLHFDICLLNDIAVANSGLIKEYSDVDIRVKSLMIAVKRWTKDNKINSAQDNTLSSYTWMNMVIFYLQCIGFVPNLQCLSLMRQCNHEMGWGKSRRRQDNINNLNTAYLKWKGQADRVWKRLPEVDNAYKSVSLLLYGFFRFYANEFPVHLFLVSIKRGGNLRLPKTMFSDRTSLYLCVEDPFETYDSHFPHDLGMPADEGGSIYISRCFRQSAEHLGQLLSGNAIEFDGDEVGLWPISMQNANSSSRPRRGRKSRGRDPNSTLVIEIKHHAKFITKEILLDIFQPFAERTNDAVEGSSVTHHGHLAFVDYSSPTPIQEALAEHKKNPLKWKGEPLTIWPKGKENLSAATKRAKRHFDAAARADRISESFKKNGAKDKESPGKKSPSKNGDREESAQTTSSDVGNDNNAKGTKDKKYSDPDKTIIVKNIRGSVSAKGMIDLFRPFADRTQSTLVSIEFNKKKTWAFVVYDSPSAVNEALKEHSEKRLEWKGKPLDVNVKQSKGSRKREQIKHQAKLQTDENVSEQAMEGQANLPTPGKASPTKTDEMQNHALMEDGQRELKKGSPKKKGGRGHGRKKKQGSQGGGGKNSQKAAEKPIVSTEDSLFGQLLAQAED